MDQNAYRDLVTGTDGRTSIKMLRFALRIISWLYTGAVNIRNFFYDTGVFKANRVDCPVISIGNITTGGTGKTPLVVWLCNYLQEKNIGCAILTRGYKSQPDKLTDEPAILARACPNAEVIVNPNRSEGAQKAIQNQTVKTLVMDDGFQHRRLGRDLNIAAIDATCPFGGGRLLPAGLLREPIKSLTRAHAVIITRYEQAQRGIIQDIEKKIKSINPNIIIAKVRYEHPFAETPDGQKLSIDELKQKRIMAFCGIANPSAFINNLKKLGFNVVSQKIFNDHHDYSGQDILDIYALAEQNNANVILCTEKDWVKTSLLVEQNSDILFAYLGLKLTFADGEDELKKLVDKTVFAE